MRYPLLLSSLRKEVSKSDLPETDSLLQKLDSTIQNVEAAAGVINELQASAERLIISREETVVRATVRRKPGVAMRRERIYRSNDHNFVSHFFNQPTFCAHCTDFIWGLGMVINTCYFIPSSRRSSDRTVHLRVHLMTIERQAGLSMHDMWSCRPQEVPRVHKLAMCGSVRWNYSIPSLCKRTSVQDKNLFSSNILRSLWGAAGGTCEAGDQMLGMQDKCARKMPPCCWFVHYRSERETWKD